MKWQMQLPVFGSCYCIMIMLTAVLAGALKLKKQSLSLMPNRFSKGYIIATCAVGALYIVTSAILAGGIEAVLLLIYGSIVTPVYEELLFRGLIWNAFEKVMPKKRAVLIWNVFLFTIWHLGYMIPHILSGNRNAVLWK